MTLEEGLIDGYMCLFCAGLWWWGFDSLLAMLPALSGFTLYSTQTEDPIPSLKPMSDIYVSDHDKKVIFHL